MTAPTMIHDTPNHKHSSLAAWPIRVGGAYQAVGPKGEPLPIWCIVTTIDGEDIHYRSEYRGLDGSVVVTIPHRVITAAGFRACDLPEDGNPTTALYAALRAMVKATEPYHQNDAAGRPWLAEAQRLLNEEELLTHAH